jgi:hypothetical protein
MHVLVTSRSAAGMIRSIEKSIHLIATGICALPTFSIVPQPAKISANNSVLRGKSD